MKEFSIFLGTLLAPADNVSVMPAFMVALPGPSSVSQVTLSIAVCLLCWRRSLSPWCWRRVLGRSMSPSCSITRGSYSVGPSKPSTQVFVVPAFGPSFHLGRFLGHTCPSWTLAWRLTPLSFLQPFIGARWDPLSKSWYSPFMFPFSPLGGFGWHCSAIHFRYMVSLPLYLLDLFLTFAPGTFFARAWLETWGWAAFVPRCMATASLGLFGTKWLPTGSLAVHQWVTPPPPPHLRWICLFYSLVSICRNKWYSYLVRIHFS